MSKQTWKAGNMLYPLPAVMVSVTDGDGHDNIITVAWAGTVCTNPAMLSISVRKERHSHAMLVKTGEFVVNLTTEALAFATDYCGVRSGRDVDKFTEMKLTKEKAVHVAAPMIGESPVNIECRVVERKELGSHDMFIAEIVAVHVNKALMDENDRFCLEKAGLMAYSHGHYYGLQKKPLGRFGFSVMKPKTAKKLKGQERENARKQFASKKKKGNEKKQNPSKKPNKK